MNTITKQDTFTAKVESVRELLAGVLTHTHTGEDLPVLNSLLLSAKGGEIIATATDRYRFIEGKIAGEGEEEGELSATLISSKDIKRVLELIKDKSLNRQLITFSRVGDLVSVSLGSNSITANAVEGSFPPYEHLFPTEFSSVESIAFNPKLFADYSKVVGKRGAVKITFNGERKPMLITLVGDKVSWRALLMPMRIA
ncbi:MAG: hypothetical protein EBR82_57855 [Caulobacteraceae bacterium]|nr:hypothetical protein [Caulobacteraceae bacterium]